MMDFEKDYYNRFLNRHTDSLAYEYLGLFKNPDGTYTTYGYNHHIKAFIQKVWSDKLNFKVVAVFKPKKVLQKCGVSWDIDTILPNNILW